MNACILRETSKGIERITPQDRLLQDRTIMFTEEVTPQSADELISALWALELEDPDAPIRLCLNSPGGEVSSGLAAYDVIMNLKSPVDTVCIGTAASMASILFLAGRERSMYSTTRIMIHDPLLSGLSGSRKALELEEEAKRRMDMRQTIASIISERSGNPLNKVLKMTAKDCYLSAGEALKLGIATKIIGNV